MFRPLLSLTIDAAWVVLFLIVVRPIQAQGNETTRFQAGQPQRGQPQPGSEPGATLGDPVFGAPAPEGAVGDTLGVDRKVVEAIVADYVKKKDAEKKQAEEDKKAEAREKRAFDLFGGTRYDLQALYDSLSVPKLEGDKKWYEKLSIRGYTQFRFTRTLSQDLAGAEPNLFGDRSVNGDAENFSIRRARLIIAGDISEHVFVYLQPDFASTPQGSTALTSFGQLRDMYADVHIDTDKEHRLRVGLSKVPYGWENLQSSQNRIPLDRTDALNSAVAPNERDLGIIYYWTPVEQQKLFKTLVDSGLKGSGNYGIFGLGIYDGQGGSIFESNLNLHTVARFTYPVQLESGQIVEASLQGFTGEFTVTGAPIRPLGRGTLATPRGTGRDTEIIDQRAAATLVWFPQPIGFQAEWQVGRGPGLNDQQTEVVARPLSGGYAMTMFRHDTQCVGVVTPYCRYQQFSGGYRNVANAAFGNQRQLDLGVEWQIRKEMELVVEASTVNVPNFTASTTSRSYQDFEGTIVRVQFQVNY